MRWLFKLFAFIKWVLSPEHLEESDTSKVADAQQLSGSKAHSARDYLRKLWTTDTLPLDPPEADSGQLGIGGILHWLLGREALPLDEPDPAEAGVKSRLGTARWLLGREALPFDEPDRQPTWSSRVRWILARESLPCDEPPTSTAPSGGVSLGWLFRRDRLEPPDAPDDRPAEPRT